MQIVIDVSSYDKEWITNGYCIPKEINMKISEAIVNGTPLPEGHGRIGDLDAVMSDINNSIDKMTDIGIIVDGQWLWEKLNDAIYNAKPIVEADKGESEDS